MKILHVLYSGLGGHGNVFFSSVKADTENEFEYEALFNGIEGLRTEYVEKCNEYNIEWSFIKKKPGIDLKYYKSLLRIIKKSNAEIIFLHSSAYILPAKLASLLSRQKKKIIIRETQANNLKTKKEWLWLSISFLWADKIIFLSEAYKSEIKRKLNRFFSEKKITIIPNGIDLNAFNPAPKINNDTFVIGMQSRIVKIKDHETLLKAFAQVKNNKIHKGKNLKLKIAGEGETKIELQRLAITLEIIDAVEFTGMLDEFKLIGFLQSLNLYIHASFGETMSTAIMQAMACGLPIIASNVPGINNMIIDNNTGILVPVQNEQLMAKAIINILNDNSFADELGENAYAFAKQNYSNLTMFKKYKELFT